MPACADADDIFFDEGRRRIYVTCGSGEVEIFERRAEGYKAAGHIATRPGARTSLFVPEIDRLIVAARATSSDAALLIYRPQP